MRPLDPDLQNRTKVKLGMSLSQIISVVRSLRNIM